MNIKLLALLVLALLGLATVASASSVRSRLHNKVRADPTLSEESSEESSESTEESSEESTQATPLKGGCEGSDSCQKVKIIGQDTESKGPSVDDAVAPVADWLKAFRKRAEGGGDIAAAAEAMAKPVVERLRMKQEAMIEKLKMSNDDILRHVQQSVTEHALKLLRSDSIAEQKEEVAIEKKEAKVEAAEAVENAKQKAESIKAAAF